MVRRLLSLFVLSALLIGAPPTIKNADLSNRRPYDFVPMLVPNSSEVTFTRDVFLQEITLTNITDSAVIVSVLDRQSTPRAVLHEISIAADTTYVIRFEARYCQNGVTWVAGTASAVIGYMRGLQ